MRVRNHKTIFQALLNSPIPFDTICFLPVCVVTAQRFAVCLQCVTIVSGWKFKGILSKIERAKGVIIWVSVLLENRWETTSRQSVSKLTGVTQLTSHMAQPISSNEATKRWGFLQGIKNLKPTKAITISCPSSSGDFNQCRSRWRKKASATETLLPDRSSYKAALSRASDLSGDPFDPFNCDSIAVLPSHSIVENVIRQYLEEWKDLDSRKISQKPITSKLSLAASSQLEMQENENPSLAAIHITDDDNTKTSNRTNNGGGWRAMEDRLFLPDGFDYSTKGSAQQKICKGRPIDEGYTGDLVVSLKDPTQRLSYHSELSKLFHSIPSYRELEARTRRGHMLHNTFRLYEETHNSIKSPTTCSALARLRMPDRHGLPQSFNSFSYHNIQSTKRRQNHNSYSHQTTVILEFWRKVPKQHAASGCHRMVMEFLSSQTLWDVHMVLTQMVEDDLWIASQDDKDSTYDSNIEIEPISKTECRNNKEDKKLKQKEEDNRYSDKHYSGCFFIESTFYVTGSVNYAKPIIDWIEGSASNRSASIRRAVLGIKASDSIKHIKKMKRTKLRQIRFRPNTRYYHTCHGDVETIVMLVDRISVQEKHKNSSGCHNFPLIHDVWTAPRWPAVPLCDACQIYQSVYVTSTDCEITDGGPRSLCQECCIDLNVLKNKRDSLKLYRQWHDQINLSKSIAHE